jgi:hypothetical protein
MIKHQEIPFSLKMRTNFIQKRTNNFHVRNAKDPSVVKTFVQNFQRMKTIFGHANLGEQPMSISCIEFDLSNKYIITASDDK